MGFVVDGTSRAVDIDFSAGYLLATKKVGKHRVTARRDWFDVDDNSFQAIDNNEEIGTSWTLAFNAKTSKRGNLITELLHIDSKRQNRPDIGFKKRQAQTLLQLSYRHRF